MGLLRPGSRLPGRAGEFLLPSVVVRPDTPGVLSAGLRAHKIESFGKRPSMASRHYSPLSLYLLQLRRPLPLVGRDAAVQNPFLPVGVRFGGLARLAQRGDPLSRVVGLGAAVCDGRRYLRPQVLDVKRSAPRVAVSATIPAASHGLLRAEGQPFGLNPARPHAVAPPRRLPDLAKRAYA